ncbi:Organic solute transporter Ostalpha [Novymonas esmeraldas]|uniref:Organic solute transporter Ostalpha n=1 Tax=Novymonas esmeraldas TaxID=1808958 RepID=A0AAW0EKT7_9TRYP
MAGPQIEVLAQRFMWELADTHTTSNSTGVVRGLDMRWVSNKAFTYAAVICAVVCCFIAFSDLRDHLSRFDYPKLQVLEMRIIMMIPIYAVFSALSLLFSQWRFFFETVRDTYESFVLYIFFMLMVSYCGGEGQLLRSLKKKRYKGMHPFPMCYLPSFQLDTAFYLRCKRWVLQCALIKPLVSFIAMVCHPLGIYKEGSFKVNNVYTYTCIIINISLTMALYYLVLFEIECEKELHYAKTFLKFLCIKSIIFFSYWQSVLVNLASSAGIIYLGAHEEEVESTGAIIQDLLMCFELLPVALLHRAAFGREKLDAEMACVPVYMKDNNTGDLRSNVDIALNVNDIIDDTFGTIFFRKGKLVDQENGGESDEDDVGYGDTAGKTDGSGGGGGGGGGAARGSGGGSRSAGGVGGYAFAGNADALARDPTLEELVRHAIATDYGVRVDGVLHYDVDSDREERNQDMNFADTDIILRRSKNEAATQDLRVDTDLLRSHQIPRGGTTPQIYCVVCGRFDRDMVRRRNGYKCKECVGSKSQSLLRRRQREEVDGDEGAADAGRGGRLGHGTAAVVVESMDVTAADFGHGGTAAAAAVSDDDEDAPYVQPMPTEANADLVGVARLPQDSAVSALPGAAALVDGFANLQQVLRFTFQGDDTKSATTRATVVPPPRAGGPPAATAAPSAAAGPCYSDDD